MSMSRPQLRFTVGTDRLLAQLELEAAAVSCTALLAMLPLKRPLLHARWSGECGWAPLGEIDCRLAPENATRYPAPGQILLYAGDLSEAEILIPYGAAAFACRAGELAGNHVLTVTEGAEHLLAIGKRLLWEGAMPMTLDRA